MHRRLAVMTLLLLAAGAAAAQNQRPLGRIAVLPSADPPVIRLDYLPLDGGTAGQEMQEALGSCGVVAPAGGHKEDLVAALVACPVFALTMGAIAAASNDPQKISSAATAVQSVFSAERALQARFGEEVARRTAQQFGERFVASPQGADTVLEVGIAEIRTLRAGRAPVDPRLRLLMSASVRVVDARTAEVLSEHVALYSGRLYRRSHWTEDGSKRLREDIERGAEALAAHAMEVGLLLCDFPAPQGQPARADKASTVFGIEPETPAAGRKWTRVESLQPELRWEPFPRPADQVAAPQEMDRARNVSYDLVIAEALGENAGPVVYRRERIAQNVHRLETALLPRHLYYWSVRARFMLDGNEYVTEWGRIQVSNDPVEILTKGAVMRVRGGAVRAGSLAAPYSGSYRFSTP